MLQVPFLSPLLFFFLFLFLVKLKKIFFFVVFLKQLTNEWLGNFCVRGKRFSPERECCFSWISL